MPFNDLIVAVVGGDSRQIAVAKALTGMFRKVRLFGHPSVQADLLIESVATLDEALDNAGVVVLPIGGLNDTGTTRGSKAEQFIDFSGYFARLPAGTLMVTGSVTARWARQAREQQIDVIQYAEDDRVAILNSIPTAEGTIQMAMEEMPITIHGSTVLVIGFGRVGITVARDFQALGAHVIVVARRPALLARATEMGCATIAHTQLEETAGRADLMINTVPAMVIDANIIAHLLPEALIIDLASPPGGTDFEAAKARGIKAILAPGLPGIVAPKTAGSILATAIPDMIRTFYETGVGANAARRN